MIIMYSSSLFFLETLLQKTLNVSSKEKSIKQKVTIGFSIGWWHWKEEIKLHKTISFILDFDL